MFHHPSHQEEKPQLLNHPTPHNLACSKRRDTRAHVWIEQTGGSECVKEGVFPY
jgi:hypothetical protein